VRSGLAKRRVRRDHRLSHHLLHQRAVLIRTAVHERIERLHDRKPPNGTHQRQRPRWHRACRIDRCSAVGPEELVVPDVEDHQVWLVPHHFLHHVDKREAGHGRRAHVDHLDGPSRPQVLEHRAQECGHRKVARLRVALGGGLAKQEDAHRAGRLWHEEVRLLRIAGAGGIGEEVGLGGRRLNEEQPLARPDFSCFTDEGRVAAPAEEPQRNLKREH